MRPKSLDWKNIALIILLASLALYAFFRFLLPWLLPFFIAFCFAALLEPLVVRLCRRGVKRPLASGICVLIFLLALGFLLWLLCRRVGREVYELSGRLPEILSGISVTLRAWEGSLSALLERAPDGLATYLDRALAELTDSLARLPAQLSTKLFAAISAFAAAAPTVLLFTVTLLIGTYFISASYCDLLHGAARALPEEFLDRARKIRLDLRRTFGRWLRAQGLMILFTFFVLTVAFLLLRIPYALLLSMFTALIDALPVLGVGTVLLPWAVYDFLTGNFPQGLGLVITYASVTVLHQSVQAKLLGDQLGLHPLATLVSIYVGWQTFGVWGMIFFPVLAVTGKQLLDSGVLRRRRHTSY